MQTNSRLVHRRPNGLPVAHSRAPRCRSVIPSIGVDRDELDAFRQRDPGAVRALYREYGRLVYAVAHRVLGQHDLAEEATQQTFVRAWQAADRIDVDRDPAPWLATIAKRTAIDIYRREARRPTSALADVPADDPALDHACRPTSIRSTRCGTCDARSTSCPTTRPPIVRLQHLDGMTHNEISEQLGIAVGTVKSRSHRAHRKLAALLGHLREAPHERATCPTKSAKR